MSEEEFVELYIDPKTYYEDAEALPRLLKEKTGHTGALKYKVLKRSVDARRKQALIHLKVKIVHSLDLNEEVTWNKDRLMDVSAAQQVVVVGAGPAGLFAALELIENGLKPIVLERGKDVQARRRDLAAINKNHIVNPNSNYCFGEGGAGTYSDGKLYTRSKKRGNVQRVLEILVAHGAKTDILIDTHPHIGTNKLPKIIQSIRDTISECGGEVVFDAQVKDLIIEFGEIKGVVYNNNDRVYGRSVILATGHSARDIFHLLDQKKVLIEAKPFALGVRIEHQQSLIDRIQYHCDHRGPYLPAAPYSLVDQVLYNKEKQGVFSFCMCPGGFIVPSATSPGEIVVNGMSPSRRDSKYANSGTVVTVDQKDFAPYVKYGPLSGMYYQQSIEQKAFEYASGTQAAPAQRMVDFVKGKVSTNLPETSYQPGLVSTQLAEILPSKIVHVLSEGVKKFGKKMKGYYTNEAQLIGVESRTSSPVRIPRDKESLEHVQIANLYPCGEGAGYAGGIISAAVDGQLCATAIKLKLNK